MSTPPPLREPTLDEALVLAMALASDGERLTVHREGCPANEGRVCACEPDVISIRRGEA